MSEIVAAILYVAVGSILMGVVTRRGIDRGGWKQRASFIEGRKMDYSAYDGCAVE